MRERLAVRHAGSFGCPACRGRLDQQDGALACPRCLISYGDAAGYLDFAPAVVMKPGLGPFYLQDPLHVPRYESVTRAAFLDVMGQNWRGTLHASDEDSYIREHLDPAGGPVLDVGCGAGRWTRTVCEHVGADAVIGLDLSTAMLAAIGTALPGLCLVRASALRLPFLDAVLGAVNCSNALQLFPDPDLAIAEIGRCLRPGGCFTAFTFRQASRPAYRYFQLRHEATFNVRAFTPADIATWLDAAGMDLEDLTGPAGAMLFTARRRP
jgi:SAM-dependent methyltransferase